MARTQGRATRLQHYTDDSMLPVAAAMASLPSLNASPTATRKLAAN